MRWLLLPVLCVACGGDKPFIEVTPTSIDWGEIDFQADQPDGGYDVRDVTVRNAGEKDLDIVIRDLDDDLLLASGLLTSDQPPTLQTLSPGSTVILQLGVVAYDEGERDTLVEGTVRFVADGSDPATLPWSFTPIRIIDTDTSM